jgi:hypothetical protein
MDSDAVRRQSAKRKRPGIRGPFGKFNDVGKETDALLGGRRFVVFIQTVVSVRSRHGKSLTDFGRISAEQVCSHFSEPVHGFSCRKDARRTKPPRPEHTETWHDPIESEKDTDENSRTEQENEGQYPEDRTDIKMGFSPKAKTPLLTRNKQLHDKWYWCAEKIGETKTGLFELGGSSSPSITS